MRRWLAMLASRGPGGMRVVVAYRRDSLTGSSRAERLAPRHLPHVALGSRVQRLFSSTA